MGVNIYFFLLVWYALAYITWVVVCFILKIFILFWSQLLFWQQLYCSHSFNIEAWQSKSAYHSAPSVPRVEPIFVFDNLYDIELVVIIPNVGLIEHTVVVFMHLWRTSDHLSASCFTTCRITDCSRSLYLAAVRQATVVVHLPLAPHLRPCGQQGLLGWGESILLLGRLLLFGFLASRLCGGGSSSLGRHGSSWWEAETGSGQDSWASSDMSTVDDCCPPEAE